MEPREGNLICIFKRVRFWTFCKKSPQTAGVKARAYHMSSPLSGLPAIFSEWCYTIQIGECHMSLKVFFNFFALQKPVASIHILLRPRITPWWAFRCKVFRKAWDTFGNKISLTTSSLESLNQRKLCVYQPLFLLKPLSTIIFPGLSIPFSNIADFSEKSHSFEFGFIIIQRKEW